MDFFNSVSLPSLPGQRRRNEKSIFLV
jgi:hypothetical protein